MSKEKIGLFGALKSSLEDVEKFYEGKITLKNYERSVSKPHKYTSEEIAELRKRLKISQAIFANLCNVSTRTVQSWEQGIRIPTGATLRLLEIFDVNPGIINQQGLL